MRAALVQLNASDDPAANLPQTEHLVREAAAGGARLVTTPEVTNCVSSSSTHQHEVLREEVEDPTLARLRAVAAETGIWLVIGSLALKAGGGESRFVNRSFLIGPDGAIRARYDKINMFDVEIGEGERYRESDGYRPGDRAVLAETPWGSIGLTICYDLRFPALSRRLAQAGAWCLTFPSAFTVPTGKAHWQVLLRARAIETGCFVLAPAQWGLHAATQGRERRTWGHSLAVDPWGTVLADGGEGTGVTLVELDPAAVAAARARVPSLASEAPFDLPAPEAVG